MYGGFAYKYIKFRAQFTEDMYRKYWLDCLGGCGSRDRSMLSPSSQAILDLNLDNLHSF